MRGRDDQRKSTGSLFKQPSSETAEDLVLYCEQKHQGVVILQTCLGVVFGGATGVRQYGVP